MLYINAYRINSLYQKLELKDHLHTFVTLEKENHNGVGTQLEFCQKNDVKNMTPLQH